MVTFAGPYRNPFDGAEAHLASTDPEDGSASRDYLYVALPVLCDCNHKCCSRPRTGWRPHTSDKRWYMDEHEDYAEAEEAVNDWIEAQSDSLERQFDDYLEDNRYEIVQMERYEMWRNEY